MNTNAAFSVGFQRRDSNGAVIQPTVLKYLRDERLSCPLHSMAPQTIGSLVVIIPAFKFFCLQYPLPNALQCVLVVLDLLVLFVVPDFRYPVQEFELHISFRD